MMTTSGSDLPTPSDLSSMKVDELREMCSELGLMVSGKKSDLIERIVGNSGVVDAEEVTTESPKAPKDRVPEKNVGDAIDKLLARFEKGRWRY